MSGKTDLESEVAQLKAQLAEVRAQSASVADKLAERANGYVTHAVETGSRKAQAAYDTGVRTAQSVATDTAVRAREAEDSMAAAIRERPFMAVGVAFAAGLMLCKAGSAAGRRS